MTCKDLRDHLIELAYALPLLRELRVAFQHKTAVKDGYTVVVVGADFKNRTIGLQVAFDSAREIAGLYVVPAP